MGNYTQGPWEVVLGTTTGRQVIAPGEPKVRRNVAACGGPNRDSNARLIACAPDMIDMLVAVEATGMLEHGGLADSIRTLIAQAGGQA